MQKYIPALKYHFLTPIYDFFIGLTMPERRFKQDLIDQMHIQAGDKVLDFGAGTITLTLMAEKEHPQAIFTAIDVDPQMITIAQKKIDFSKSQINLVKYEGEQLPFPTATFDCVMSSLVFSHQTTEQKLWAFSEIKRVLKPTGEFHVADWGKAHNVGMRVLFFILQIFDNFYTTTENVQGKMPELMQKSGLKEVEITRNYATIFGTLQLFKAKNAAFNKGISIPLKNLALKND